MVAHILISLFATSILLIASVQALLMGLQNTLLKRHRVSVILNILPPLQVMETALFWIVGSGMFFLSCALLSGFFLHTPSFSPLVLPKALLALCAWVLLVLLCLGRFWFGWRGPTAIRWTLIITLLTVLSYFGTKIL